MTSQYTPDARPDSETDARPVLTVMLAQGRTIEVSTLEEASAVCRAFIASGDYGASELPSYFGRVTVAGRKVARIAYNGRIFADGAR